MAGIIIDDFNTQSAMSKQAIDSSEAREGLIDVLPGLGQLYVAVRQLSDGKFFQPPVADGRVSALARHVES